MVFGHFDGGIVPCEFLASKKTLKEKDHKTTTEFCLTEFRKLNILMQISPCKRRD